MRLIQMLLALIIFGPLVAAAEDLSKLGSGFADIEGTTINYEYVDFGGFYYRIADGKGMWQGFVGIFTDAVSETHPQISRVADDVYFVSWPTRPGRGDNVVWNLKDMTVNAHLGGGAAFQMIHGEIYCWNQPECHEPQGPAQSPEVIRGHIDRNVRVLGYANRAEAFAPDGEMGPPDERGMADLTGKNLRYSTVAGPVVVKVDGRLTHVSTSGAAPTTHPTHATWVAEGVYFISWGGEHGGNHIVFNTLTGKIYDHIQPDGSRAESIHEVGCFGDC